MLDVSDGDSLSQMLRACSKAAIWAAEAPDKAGKLLAEMAKKGSVSEDLSDATFNAESLKMLIELGALCPRIKCSWDELKEGNNRLEEEIIAQEGEEGERTDGCAVFGNWGEMDMGRWASFVAWAFSPGQIEMLKFPQGPDSLNLNRLYTNEYLRECCKRGRAVQETIQGLEKSKKGKQF